MKSPFHLPKQWKENLMVAGTVLLFVALVGSSSFIDDHIGLNIDQIGWVFSISIAALVLLTMLFILIGSWKSKRSKPGSNRQVIVADKT